MWRIFRRSISHKIQDINLDDIEKLDIGGMQKRLDLMIEMYVQSGKIAGAVCDVRVKGSVIYQRTAGFLNLNDRTTVNSDSVFKVFSLTKPLTAAIVLQLVDRGSIKLDDPLHLFLPNFKNLMVTRAGSLDPSDWKRPERDITIRHLILNLAGFTYSFLGRTPLHRRYAELSIHARTESSAAEPRSLMEVMDRLATLPLLSHPGSQWSYGVSYDVLGAVVEVVSGATLGAVLEQNILRPLAMPDTSFFDEAFIRQRAARVATSYTPAPSPAGGHHLEESRSSSGAYLIGGVHYGGGGLLTTAPDYHRFLAMLLAGGVGGDGRQVLSPRAVRLLSTVPQLPPGTPVRGAQALSFRQLGGYAPAGGAAVLADPAASAEPGRAGEFIWEGSESSVFLAEPHSGLAALWLCQLRPLGALPVLRQLKRAVYGPRPGAPPLPAAYALVPSG